MLFTQGKPSFLSNFLKANEKLVKVFDAVYTCILIADEDAIVCYVNEGFTRIFGTKPEKILGKHLNPHFLLPGVLKTGNSIIGAYKKDGDIEYVVDIAPIIIDGKIVGGISTAKDFNEVHKLHEELQKYVKAARHLNKIVSRAYEAKYFFDKIIANSQEMQETIGFAQKASKGQSNILITGESGTGKEMFAQAIHNASKRRDGKFVAVNCAAIAPSLVESELFGYEDGAFTGGKKGGNIGLFEVADGGTIFFDEIGELSLDIQAKLLRVLQEKAIRKIGASVENMVDIRVVAATNKNLQERIREGYFREDLYYRLNVVNINLPPLRQRGNDVQLLAEAFLQEYSEKNKRDYKFDKETISVLLHYSWPGNIRELRNVIEYSINVCDEDDLISVSHLPEWLQPVGKKDVHGKLADLIQEFEKQTLLLYLNKYGHSVNAKKRIAKELGISVATLYNKLRA